jgi:hypothetical protein
MPRQRTQAVEHAVLCCPQCITCVLLCCLHKDGLHHDSTNQARDFKSNPPDDASSKPAYISSCRGALQHRHQTISSITTT